MLFRRRLVFVSILFFACAFPALSNTDVPVMDAIATSYVKLALALGQHDSDYVDAFYGPPEWKKEMEEKKLTLNQIEQQVPPLLEQLKQVPESSEELMNLRHEYLVQQLESLRARIQILNGKKMTFDEESKALYDAVAPKKSEVEFQEVLDQLNALIPGKGSLIERYEIFQNDFVIPPAKLDAVFNAAIKECRTRTLRHVALPESESFTLEYVKGKTWSGYNWYQGNYRSLIQLNTDLPIYIDRAIDLAGHEGYPGHHVYNVLLEKHLVKDRGWMEFTVYPLFSSQSLIAEGTANFGVKVLFTDSERLVFEKTVLFPLAGLDPARAENYYKVVNLVEQLSYAGNEAARRYLNGEIDAKDAAEFLTRYGMMTPARAEQRVRFMDKYRSYVINYNYGQDLVKEYIVSHGGTPDHPERRWEEFTKLLSSPRLPSELH